MKTKILAIMLTVLMVLTLVPTVSFGAEGDSLYEDFEGEFTESEGIVSGGKIHSANSIANTYGEFTIAKDTNSNSYLKHTITKKSETGEHGTYLRVATFPSERYQVAEMDVMVKQVTNNSVGARIHLATSELAAFKRENCVVGLNIYNSCIYVYEGDVSTSVATITYADYGIANYNKNIDDWRNLKIVYDKETLQYDVIFDGKLVATDIPSNAYTGEDRALGHVSYNTNTTKITNYTGLDNVRIYGVTAQEANEIVATGLNNLVGTIDLYNNNVITLPFAGLVGDTRVITTTTSKYNYSVDDEVNAKLSVNTFNTATSKPGENSTVTVSNLPETAFDTPIDIDLTATITRYDDENKPVVKTAVYNLNAASDEKITFRDITGTIPEAVTEDLILPETFTSAGNTYDIEWASDSELIDVETGRILRCKDKQKVKLTATFSLNGTTAGEIVFPVTILADGEIYFQEYFEPIMVEGVAGVDASNWNDWKFYNPGKDNVTATITTDPKNFENRAVKIVRTAKDDKLWALRKDIGTTLDGKVVASARIYMDEYPGDSYFYMTLNQNNANNRFAVMGLGSDGFVYNRQMKTDGSGETNRVVNNEYTYPLDTWLDVKMVINTISRKYDIYINGEKINSTPCDLYCSTTEIRDARNTPDEFRYIDFSFFKNCTSGTAYVDDVVIYSSDGDSFEVTDMDENSITIFNKGYDSSKAANAIIAVYSGNKLESVKMLDITSFGANYEKTFSDLAIDADETDEVKVYAIEQGTLVPLMHTYTGEESQPEEKTTVYIAGDSTAHTYLDIEYPQAGWGQVIGDCLPNDVVVDNRAMGGRSTRSFITEGRLDDILYDIKPGDYLLVQFGHNDNKDYIQDVSNAERYTDPETTYHDYLAVYVDEARKKGAHPVFITSISRYDAYEEGKVNGSSLGKYPEEMVKAANELNVPVIDMFTKSVAEINTWTADKAKDRYLHIEANDQRYMGHPLFTEGNPHYTETVINGKEYADYTHFTFEGANIWAEMIADELKTIIE